MKNLRITEICFGIIFILFSFGLLMSCEDDEADPPKPDPIEDVYVAGTLKSNYYGRATYWKNGVPSILNMENQGSNANDIFIDGSDVYVVGSKINEDMENIPQCWVNGRILPIRLVGASGDANSVFLSDGVVYVAGTDDGVGKLWVSEFGVELRPPSGASSEFNSVYVAGDTVYVGGYEYEGNVKHAKYWSYSKSGPNLLQAVDLEQFHNSQNANVVHSIVVKDGDIYVAGHNGKNATLWKNNHPINLYPTEYSFHAYSIAVKGNDVYVLGSGGDNNTNNCWYWKNGEITNLARGDADYVSARGIALGEENIYVAGDFDLAQDEWAVLWTNNIPMDITLNRTRSWTRAIKVMPR